MSAGTIFETAICLATQAVQQDKAKNYAEAARCYREAVSTFASVRGKCATPQVAAAVDAKISEYRDRLRKLDHYLLSKADLSKIFKSAVDYHVDSQTYHSAQCTDIQRGIQLIERAKRRDKERDFKEALSLYEQGSAELLQVALKAQKDNRPEQSDKIRFKCLLIHERIDEIRNALENGRDVKDRREVTNNQLATGSMTDNSAAVKSRSGKGFDSCSASPEPPAMVPLHPMAMSMMSMASVATYASDDRESRIFLMDEVRSVHSVAAMRSSSTANILAETSKQELPLLKRSPSLNSDFGGSNTSSGACDLIPLANMDQELTLSDDSVADSVDDDDDDCVGNDIDSIGNDVDSVYSYSETVRRMVGVKTAEPSVASSTRCSVLGGKNHKYRSFHASAENVLSAFAGSADVVFDKVAATADTTVFSDSYVEQDRNVSEVVVSYDIPTNLDDTSCSDAASLPLLNTSCDSQEDDGSDSGISNPCSTWKRETPESPTLVIDSFAVKTDDDDVVVASSAADDTVSETTCATGLSETTSACSELVLETVVVEHSPPPECVEVVHVEVEQSSSPSPTLSRTSTGSRSRESDHERQRSLTRKPSTLKKHQSASIDELRVLSSEDVVDYAARPHHHTVPKDAVPKSGGHHKKSVKLNPTPKVDNYYYGQPETLRRTEYVPPRAFAARPDFEDESMANKGCYYFLSCLDAFWIL